MNSMSRINNIKHDRCSSDTYDKRCPCCGRLMGMLKKTNVWLCYNPACQVREQSYFVLK